MKGESVPEPAPPTDLKASLARMAEEITRMCGCVDPSPDVSRGDDLQALRNLLALAPFSGPMSRRLPRLHRMPDGSRPRPPRTPPWGLPVTPTPPRGIPYRGNLRAMD